MELILSEVVFFIQLQLLLSVEPECYSLLSAQEHAVFCAR